MILRLGIAALAAALVAACQTAAPETQWTKSGATPEDVKRDLYWCTNQVEHRRVFQTPADPRRVTKVVDEECMENRGYKKKG